MSAGGAAAYLTSEALRRGLSRRKVLDQVFVLVGLIVMIACLAVLAILFIDLVRDGADRFNLDFQHREARDHDDESDQHEHLVENFAS